MITCKGGGRGARSFVRSGQLPLEGLQQRQAAPLMHPPTTTPTCSQKPKARRASWTPPSRFPPQNCLLFPIHTAPGGESPQREPLVRAWPLPEAPEWEGQ